MDSRVSGVGGWLTLLMSVVFLVACGSDTDKDPAPSYRSVEGATMGTYYRVQYREGQSCATSQQTLDELLMAFNQSLSTYITDSEISEFNRANAQSWQSLSPRFSAVLQAALQVWRQSEGAFDVTIGPSVNLWGFGPEDMVELPSLEAQRLTSRWVGMDQLQLDAANSAAQKNADEVYVDLSALAKGLGVDELAEHMAAKGCTDFMVDIGGEMRTRGSSPANRPWRIGIEKPVPGARSSIQRVLSVSGQGVATSGDYRNFREVDGIRVDHVIDPRSGQPADNQVASVTVIHPQAMYADAYATTIMVLGGDAGLGFAERLNLAVLIIEKSTDGAFVERYTPPMLAYIVAPAS